MTRCSDTTFQFINFTLFSMIPNKERTLIGGFSSGIIDLYMFDKLNDTKLNENLYLINTIPRGSDVYVLNNLDYVNIYQKMKEYCKLKFNIDISIEELQKNIPK